jgi:hypothetical protein
VIHARVLRVLVFLLLILASIRHFETVLTRSFCIGIIYGVS